MFSCSVFKNLKQFSNFSENSQKCLILLGSFKQFSEPSGNFQKCQTVLGSVENFLEVWNIYYSFIIDYFIIVFVGILYRFVKKRELFFVTESELKPCDTMVGKLIYWFIKWFSSYLKHGCSNIYELLMYSGRCSCITQPGASSENSVYYN